LSDSKKISQELYNLKDELVNNKLKDVNFDTLDLINIINDENGNNDNELGGALNNGKSVEELVKEILRPELTKWLNDNLPAIVKQLVEKEIKKIIPKNE
jgi:DNA polymerase III alpha subunit (gram-positive type)